MLIEARNDLEIIKRRLDSLIGKSPKAQIRLKKVKSGIYVYKRTDSFQTNGTYVKKNNTKEIKLLVQKLYNTRLKEAVDEEKRQIEDCIAILRGVDTAPEAVLRSIPAEMHRFINTDVFNDTDSVEEWRREVFMENNPIKFEKAFRTSNGEMVRSKSELIIAEALKALKVPYIYERPFRAYMTGYGKANIFPDFTCFNKRTGKTYYWEHLGLMDNPEYASKNMRKILDYSKEGVYPGTELILSFETADVPLSTEYIRALIRKYLL